MGFAMFRVVAIAAGLALLAGSASAETIERTVKANTVSAIGGFLGYEVNTCYPSVVPDVKVRQAPANGTIQEIAVGANRFPVSALLSGDAPGQVLIVPTAAAAAGGTALRARTGKEALSPASREGGPDSVIVDLLQGRLRR